MHQPGNDKNNSDQSPQSQEALDLESQLPANQSSGQSDSRIRDLSRSMWNYSITLDDINEYVIREQIFYKLIAINLMYTGLSDAMIAPIADALRNQACTVRILHLGYNPRLTSTGVIQIASALETNSSLVNLEFQQNAIGDRGARSIADMLQLNTTLVSLGLNGRHFPSSELDITTQGIRDLAFALNPFQCRRPNRTLRELSVWGNLAGDDGVSALADMLMHNSTLEFLGLGRNGLTSESGKHISRALAQNRSLTSLDLRVNALGDKGVLDFTRALAQNPRIITINLIENGLRNSILQDAQLGLIPLLRSVQNSVLVYVALQPGDVCDIQAKPLFGTKEYLLSWVPPFKRWGSMAAGAAPAMARTGVFTSFRTVGEHFNRVMFGMTNRFSSECVNDLRLICQGNFLNYLSQHLTPDLSQRLVELYNRRKGSTVINEAWVDKSLLDQEHTTSVVSSLRSQEKVLFAIIARNPEFYDNYFRKIHSKYNDVFAEYVDIESRYIHTLTLLLKYRNENDETKRLCQPIEQLTDDIKRLTFDIAMLFSALRGRFPDLTYQNLDRINPKDLRDPDIQRLFKLRQDREALINRRNQEVERLLKIVLPRSVQEPLVLSDRRRIVIRGVQTAADDGNCGFRSILGEAYLKENETLFTRKGVIEFLKARLSSMAIRLLVAKDILAKYNEWVAGQWFMEQDKLFPIEIKTRFIAFRQRAAQNNDPGYQSNLLREIEEYCRQDNTLLSYLNNYLINDSIWPHLQGSLLAFANILGIRVHCFQKQVNGNYQVLVDDGQDLHAQYREEVFILQSEARNHFDRLVVEMLPPAVEAAPVAGQANYDPRFLSNPPPRAATLPVAPASQPAFSDQQIHEIEAHAASLRLAKK